MHKSFLLVFSCFAAGLLSAQAPKLVVVSQQTATPALDGVLTDSCWQAAQPLDDFTTVTPVFGKVPHCRTEVRLFYTETALCVAVFCFDPDKNGVRRDRSLRDTEGTGDWFRLSLDTWNDGQLAFDFTVSAAGVQADARQGSAWNTNWQSAVAQQAAGWSAEICIPFTALRFPHNKEQTWGLQLTRYDRSTGETSTWNPQDPLVQDRVWQFGTLTGLRDIRQLRRRSLGIYSKTDFTTKITNRHDNNSFWQTLGIDGRWGLKESATLDFTVLPPLAVQAPQEYLVGGGPAPDPLVGNAALPEPRQLMAEESDLFEKGTGLTQNPVIQGTALLWRRDPQAPGMFIYRYEPSKLLQATKLTARTRGNWRFGLYNALLGPVKAVFALPYDNTPGFSEYRKETLQNLSNYNYFSAEYLLRNNSYIHFSNATLLAGPGASSVLPTLNFRLRDPSNTYELSGSGQLGYHDSFGKKWAGGGLDLAIAHVNRRWGWALRHVGLDRRFYDYLLPFPNGPQWRRPNTGANITYRNYQPNGFFLNVSGAAGVALEWAWYAGDRNKWTLQANLQGLDRQFRRYSIELFAEPQYQFYTYNRSGAELKRKISPLAGGTFRFASDLRKRFQAGVEFSASRHLHGELPALKIALTPAWVICPNLSLKGGVGSSAQFQLLSLLSQPGGWYFLRYDAWAHFGFLRADWYLSTRMVFSLSVNTNNVLHRRQEAVELQTNGELTPVPLDIKPLEDANYTFLTLGFQYFLSPVSQIRFSQTLNPGHYPVGYFLPDGPAFSRGAQTQLTVIYQLDGGR